MSALFVGFVLLAIQAVLAVSLPMEVWRNPDTGGISVVGEAVVALDGAAWVAYALMKPDTVVVISGLMAVVAGGIVVSLLAWLNGRHERLRLYATTLACLAVFAIPALAFGATGLGIALAVSGIFQYWPQMRMSARALLRRERATGVPTRAAALRVAYNGSWGAYAVAGAASLPLLVWAIAGTVTFSMQFASARLGRVESASA